MNPRFLSILTLLLCFQAQALDIKPALSLPPTVKRYTDATLYSFQVDVAAAVCLNGSTYSNNGQSFYPNLVVPDGFGGMNVVASSTGAPVSGLSTLTFVSGSAGCTAPNLGYVTATAGGIWVRPTSPRAPLYLKVKMVGGGAGGCGSGGAGQGCGSAGTSTIFGSGIAGSGFIGNFSSGAGGLGGGTTLPAAWLGFSVTGGPGGGQVMGNTMSGAIGGVSYFGGGGGGIISSGSQAAPANSGSGGMGGGTGIGVSAYTGPGGGAGGYVEAIIKAPAIIYNFRVGAGGAAGTAGAGGIAGGAGAAGQIIVEEYYQ